MSCFCETRTSCSSVTLTSWLAMCAVFSVSAAAVPALCPKIANCGSSRNVEYATCEKDAGTGQNRFVVSLYLEG